MATKAYSLGRTFCCLVANDDDSSNVSQCCGASLFSPSVDFIKTVCGTWQVEELHDMDKILNRNIFYEYCDSNMRKQESELGHDNKWTRLGGVVFYQNMLPQSLLEYAVAQTTCSIRSGPPPLVTMNWKSAELICYSSDIAASFNLYIVHVHIEMYSFHPISRYTFFLVLYPMGVTGELLTIYAALPYVQKTGLYSVTLPNKYNFSFDYYTFLILTMVSYIPRKSLCLSLFLCLSPHCISPSYSLQ